MTPADTALAMYQRKGKAAALQAARFIRPRTKFWWDVIAAIEAMPESDNEQGTEEQA